jgi:apolipoprotein N-acyltransferase
MATTLPLALKKRTATTTAVENPGSVSFWRTCGVAGLGSGLLWLAFPPLGLWPLAWLAPLPWLSLVAQPQPLGRRGYWALWLASFAFWGALLQGLRLAHPLLIPGWLVLTAYLGVYLPLFVGMSRMLVHRWRWPLAVAAPLAWVGLEFARAYLATGFAAAMLSQTQTPWPLILQTADIFGAYGPSCLIMLVATAVAVWYLPGRSVVRWTTTAVAASALIAALVYGGYRMQQTLPEGPGLKVMLIQGNQDTVLDGNENRPRWMDEEYRELTLTASRSHPDCDLIVWPESAFVYPQMTVDDDQNCPDSMPKEEYEFFQMRLSEVLQGYANAINRSGSRRTSLLVGSNSVHYTSSGRSIFNAAFLISPEGQLSGRYFKNHRVLCGEYMPFGEWFPIIYRFVPIQGLSPGREFASFKVGDVRLAPNICFESVQPQLLVRQHNELAAKGEEPDLLVNCTNDGWFYGSSILDIHFQCAILRAIENRKPFLIAANTGISGVIDGNGRVMQRGPTHNTAVLVADVRPDGRSSLFHTLGDWPAGACLIVSLVMAIGAVIRSRRQKIS